VPHPLPKATASSQSNGRLRLLEVPGPFAVCKLPPGSPIPVCRSGDFFSVTVTADEVSVVCRQETAPADAIIEKDWRCLRVAGAMPFTAIGILAALTTPLANAGISVFALSTFDTDYLLVKATEFEGAITALGEAGHGVERNCDETGAVPADLKEGN
jgi:nitrilase